MKKDKKELETGVVVWTTPTATGFAVRATSPYDNDDVFNKSLENYENKNKVIIYNFTQHI